MTNSIRRKVLRVLMPGCFALLLIGPATPGLGQQATSPADEPPTIPFSYDAFLEWEQWPYLRIGVRPLMRSTFDRRGGNHAADASHYIRQVDDTHNITVEETGPGILWFVRHNHWHGSPWEYRVDGQATIVQESSTADPVHPVENSVFEPQSLFPKGLTYTWSVTKGADLSWVPVPFEKDFRMAYGRTRYGTGYYIFWKVPPGFAYLSRPLESWGQGKQPPQEVLKLIDRSGTDLAPAGDGVSSESGTTTLEANQPALVWQSESGPTMLRRIAFRVAESEAHQLADARLRIYWDDRQEPSVDAPLGLFFGAGSLLRDDDQEYIVKSFPMTIKYEDGEFLFATYFPMPFHESARITLAETTGTEIDVDWEIRREDYTGPPNHVGLFHATYRDFPHPEEGQDLELLDTRTVEGGGAWCGHIVGTTYIFTQNGYLGTLEGDPRFYMDDSLSPQGQGTGSEEWGGGGDYWGGRRMSLPFAGHPVGRPPNQVEQDIDKIHSAYRFLLTDLLPFGRNARFTLEHGGENNTHEHYETVTYWYGLQEPALVLTDEFDVGDLDDERRHNYSSPDATQPETVASRHQVGVDHVRLAGAETSRQVVPRLADDGRRTTGTSEFTVAVHRDNLGVMLRRRLDLDYPDQKARVYVADASTDDPQWQDAGLWYTAGGSTAVYSDPLVVPEDQRTEHPEVAGPVHVVWDSNRRWRDDEFLLPPALTEGREKIRVKVEYVPVNQPLFPGHPQHEEAWTEFRYWAYSFVMPGVDQ